jgi:hypothetical protein
VPFEKFQELCHKTRGGGDGHFFEFRKKDPVSQKEEI